MSPKNPIAKKKICDMVLDALRKGAPITMACKRANVDVSTLWAWRKADKHLDDAVFEARHTCTQMVEDALYSLALSGNVTAQIFWLKNRAPDQWRDRHELKHTGVEAEIELPDAVAKELIQRAADRIGKASRKKTRA